MSSEVLAAIVAGGGSRRMGADKAATLVAGVPMAQLVVEATEAAGLDNIVVGRDSPLAGVAAVPDDRPARRGPLAGLATALRVAAGRPVLLVAVDQPLVRPETLRTLAAMIGLDAVVPVDQGVLQVTCALYPGEWAAVAAAEDEAGGSIQSLLRATDVAEVQPETWRTWDEDGRSWFSVDTPADVARAEQLLADTDR